MSVLHLENENFNEVINSGLVLVDFYAEWCGPCKMLGPVLEEVSSELTDINIIKVNVDEHSELAQKYGVMSIPTLILFKDGQEVEKNIGFITKEDMVEFINKNK